MTKNILKFGVYWVVGVIIGQFAISLWRNEQVNWVQIILLIIVGLLGATIGTIIRKLIRRNKI